MRVPDYAIPPDVRVFRAERNRIAEVNSVYRCVGKKRSSDLTFYLKVTKGLEHSIENERRALLELSGHPVPVPRVLWHGKERREFLALEEMPGIILRDVLNPLSPHHEALRTNDILREVGEIIATLHSLPVRWDAQKRRSLYSFLGEEEIEDVRFREIVLWLKANPPPPMKEVFTHGDLNDANILIHRTQVSAILDWESAGMGWKEYELAWVLRERRNYLNTEKARQSLLEGYQSKMPVDFDALRWCEVMNCMHVAYWCKDVYPNYMDFNLNNARAAMFRGYE